MIYVLDASALLAATLHEPGGDNVVDLMSASDFVFMHAINAFEVVGKLMLRGLSHGDAWEVVNRDDIKRVTDIGDDLVHKAIDIKYGCLPLSLGDSFCIALAESLGGVVLTTDRAFSRAQTTASIRLIR